MGAGVWVDCEGRYFVTTAGNTLPGETTCRERWRHVANESLKVTTEINILNFAETYYKAASQIDRHNQCCHDDHKLEKRFQVKEWYQSANTSLLSICIIDAWLLYKDNRGSCA